MTNSSSDIASRFALPMRMPGDEFLSRREKSPWCQLEEAVPTPTFWHECHPTLWNTWQTPWCWEAAVLMQLRCFGCHVPPLPTLLVLAYSAVRASTLLFQTSFPVSWDIRHVRGALSTKFYCSAAFLEDFFLLNSGISVGLGLHGPYGFQLRIFNDQCLFFSSVRETRSTWVDHWISLMVSWMCSELTNPWHFLLL